MKNTIKIFTNYKKEIIFILNWKLNGNKNIINIFIDKINEFINKLTEINKKKIKIVIAPPILYIDYVNNIIDNNKNITLCSQNVDINIFGSYTGEISVKMLKEINVKYVLIGHSERKNYHNENNDLITKKFYITKVNNLIPILCISENNDVNNKENTFLIQISDIILKYGIKILYNSIIAYEPIWAIGTGLYPSVNHINKIYNSIFNYLEKYDSNIKKKIKFQYGGSVSSINSNNIILNSNIDGLLIGKSSINYLEIIRIINNYINII